MNWLLLRGLGRERRHWGEFPALLQARSGGEVACVDLPGSGTEYLRRSPASISAIVDDVRHRWLADYPQVNAWSVLGISLGGMLALQWMQTHPQEFALGVVINSSSAGLSGSTERLQLQAGLSLLRSGLYADVHNRESRILQLVSNYHADDAELAAQWVEYANSAPISRTNVLRQLLAASRFSAPDVLQPALLLLGSHADRMVNPSCSQALARHFGAELRMHPDAGHELALDDPNWVVDRVLRFTQQQG